MKKVINKYFLSFLIFLLILSIFFFTGFYFFKNYKGILSAVGIKIEENCSYKDKKLICDYINLKTDNIDLAIKNISLELHFKKFFSREKAVFLDIDNLNLRFIHKNLKERKSKGISINDLKEVLRYSYFFLGMSQIRINNIDITIENKNYLAIKNLSLENINNQFYTLKPFIIAFNDKKIEFTNFYGEIDPLTNALNIYSLQFNGYNTEFVFTGSYRIDGYMQLSGHTFTKNYKIKNINFSGLETFFDINITPTKRVSYTVDYSLNNLKIENNINAKNLNGNITGKYYKTAKGKFSSNIEKISFNENSAFNTSLTSDYDIDLKNLTFYSKNIIKTDKIESKYIKIKNLSTDFTAKKIGRLYISGNFNIDNLKGEFSFKENEFLKTKTAIFKLSKLKSWIKNYPSILKELNSNIALNLNFYIPDKILTSNITLNNINLFGIPFQNGTSNINYSFENFKGGYQINLLNDNSSFSLSAETKKNNITGDFYYKNINITNLVFTKNQKLASILSGNGIITGNITNPKISSKGQANYLFFDEIKLNHKINYLFDYKNFNINIKANTKNLNSVVKIGLKPFFIDLNINAKDLKGDVFYDYLVKLQPVIFNNIKPEKVSGLTRIVYSDKSYFVDLNIKKADVLIKPVKNVFSSKINGYIASKNNNLNILFKKDNFIYKNFHISKIYGKGQLIDKNFLLSLEALNSKNFNDFKLNTFLNLDIQNKTIKSNLNLFILKNKYNLTAYGNVKGKFENFSGKINYQLLSDKGKVSSSNINLIFNENSNYHIKFISEDIPFNLKNKIISNFKKVKYDIYISKKGEFDSYLYIDNFFVHMSRLDILNARGILAKIDKNQFYLYPSSFSGILEGNINNLVYEFNSNYLSINSKGKVNKQAISQIIQILSIYGNIEYDFSFNGKINEFLDKSYLKLYSKNLKVKSNYIFGYIQVKDLIGIYKNKNFKISLEGKNSFITYGDNIIKTKASVNISPLDIKTSIITSMFPIKYQNIFIGNINSNLYISYGKEKYLKGDISLSGQLNLSLNNIPKKTNATSSQNDNLKQMKLDLNINSFIPIYIFGNWGKSYAEIKGKITGDAANPVFNGEINIIYGKITYLRNNYNIDFANIKVINNIPYINARISTVVANTYIFVNITGAAPDNLQFTFNSTPPKSKEEIMAILLLKNTPGALEAIPVFSAIGKLMLSILPINKAFPNTSEEKGFLNTGFEITIAPRYSPTEGITASVYAKRDLTRRLFIAISRPISQTTQTTTVGWYEMGIKLTETISLIGRNYENNVNEINLIFSLPFDF